MIATVILAASSWRGENTHHGALYFYSIFILLFVGAEQKRFKKLSLCASSYRWIFITIASSWWYGGSGFQTQAGNTHEPGAHSPGQHWYKRRRDNDAQRCHGRVQPDQTCTRSPVLKYQGKQRVRKAGGQAENPYGRNGGNDTFFHIRSVLRLVYISSRVKLSDWCQKIERNSSDSIKTSWRPPCITQYLQLGNFNARFFWASRLGQIYVWFFIFSNKSQT